jgi:hypothetical protein
MIGERGTGGLTRGLARLMRAAGGAPLFVAVLAIGALAVAAPVHAASPVTIGSVTGDFYANPNDSGPFDSGQLSSRLFELQFPLIDFNPTIGVQVSCSNSVAVSNETRPFTDVVPNPDGTCGTIAAETAGSQAGVGSLNAFEAVFSATLTVASAGEVTFSFFSDDGWILGIGPQVGGTAQPAYASGSKENAPETSALHGYSVVGAFNNISAPTQRPVTVTFPQAGTYPLEVDYSECCDGQLALILATEAGSVIPPTPPPHEPKVELPPPGTTSTTVGSPFAITATVTEGGVPQAGVPVTFTVTGANPQTASAASNSAGQASFSYAGVKTGIDHIVASFVDKAGQTVVSNQVSEIWAAKAVIPVKEEKKKTLADLAAPVLGKSVNVEPVSGSVFIKLPPGAKLSRVGVALSGLTAPAPVASDSLSKGVGFIPLTEARQVPVGSTLDTREGVVKLATAEATAGKQQLGEFSAGIFTVLQARKQKGLATLTVVNATPKSVCATIGKKAQAASTKHLSHRVLGLLKGSAHGKYTTNGTYSAATVRGTIWSVANRCDGTFTAVTRGVVSVRDFARRKTITLRAGQHYLAKAP